MESATIKKSLLFSKTESTSKTESNIIFCMIAVIGLTSHVPMRDNALPIGHNPVLFDVLRDYGMVSDIFDGDGLAD